MLNRRQHGLRVLAFFGVELLVLTGAFFGAYALRRATDGWWSGYSIGPLKDYLWLWPATLAIWSLLLWIFNGYVGFRSRGPLNHGVQTGLVSLSGTLGLFALLTIVKEQEVNRSLVGLIGVLSGLGLLGFRTLMVTLLGHYTQQGYDRHYVLIAGTSAEALALAEELEGVRGAVFQVRGFVGEEPGRALGRWTVLGTAAELPALLKKDAVDDVYMLPTSGHLEDQKSVIEACEAMGISVHLRLAAFERMISRLSVAEQAGGEYLTFSTAPREGPALVLKRLVDVTGALLLLLLSAPLLLVTMLLIRLTSRGAALFRQERVGMNGRVFTLYKLRTMVEGAELQRSGLESKNELDGPAFKMKADPRVTWLGRILRKTSIDELPQLWNVVKGDMSLVGPRPLPTYEVEKFEPWQRRRMSMRPGITCLWQISGRNKVTSFDDWMRLDLEYVDRWSPALDLKILLKTLPAVLRGRGAY